MTQATRDAMADAETLEGILRESGMRLMASEYGANARHRIIFDERGSTWVAAAAHAAFLAVPGLR